MGRRTGESHSRDKHSLSAAPEERFLRRLIWKSRRSSRGRAMAIVWLSASFLGVRRAGRSQVLGGFATAVVLTCGGLAQDPYSATSAVVVGCRPPGLGAGCSGDESRSCRARAGSPRPASPPHGRCGNRGRWVGDPDPAGGGPPARVAAGVTRDRAPGADGV